MFTKAVTTKVVVALALAILMAWAGHTYTLLVGANQPDWEVTDDGYHVHDDQADLSCASCSDHYHSPLTGDHLHETPYLTTALSLPEQPKQSVRTDVPRYFLPSAPIFLIERPPRPSLVL
ncbi:hypothetical protein [Pseudomonas sp. 2FE]|uniref:hypothetical protein n=1 Tax=Pseudomonas sp. 2FE TaxID=2502190 RepID=UPI0010F60D54|nr:hypothetical protein [Pseudomonas sp. 2FE]